MRTSMRSARGRKSTFTGTSASTPGPPCAAPRGSALRRRPPSSRARTLQAAPSRATGAVGSTCDRPGDEPGPRARPETLGARSSATVATTGRATRGDTRGRAAAEVGGGRRRARGRRGRPEGARLAGSRRRPHPDRRPVDRHGRSRCPGRRARASAPAGTTRSRAASPPRRTTGWSSRSAGPTSLPGCRWPAAGSTSRTSSTSPSSAGSRRSSSARRPGSTADAEKLGDLSAAFADVATRRRVPFVDTFTPLASHEQWLGDLAAGDGIAARPGRVRADGVAGAAHRLARVARACRTTAPDRQRSQSVTAASPAPRSGRCRARSATCRP